MAKKNPKKTALVGKIDSEPSPGASRDFFGPPALIPGEDPAAYELLLARITAAAEPNDVLEEIWAREMVDLEWAVLRWRRLKANLLRVGAPKGVYAILESLSGASILDTLGSRRVLSSKWAQRDPTAVKEVEGHLAKAGLTIDAVMAQTLANNLDSVERIDRMLASAEARRDAAVRELDRHRAVLAAAVRLATNEIEDAQFVEIAATAAEASSQ